MRILHTSDWHLGQHFMGKTREQEHRQFIDWLLATVRQQKVDVIIIAGDIFDTGVPPSYARTLYNDFVTELQTVSQCQLVVLGGNHDSVATLHESRSLFACLNTTVVGAAGSEPEKQVLVLKDQEGTPGAVLCAIPYIRPRDVLTSRAGESGEDKQKALLDAMTDHYKSVYLAAEKEAKGLGVPIIATGHLTTVGGQLSESVREIYIGTLSAFPVSAFPPADYIALGHLHRGQTVSGHDHIRYSGSPIPLSFDESSSGKQVLLVDFNEDCLKGIQSVDVPLYRRLESLHGDFDSIIAQVQEIADKKQTEDLTPWLEIVIDDSNWVSDLQNRIETLVSELPPVEVLRVRRKKQQAKKSLVLENRETLAELTEADVFARRLDLEELDEEASTKLTIAFNQIVAEINEDDPVEAVIVQRNTQEETA